MQLPLLLSCTSLPLTPQSCQDLRLPSPWSSGSSRGNQLWVSPLQEGHREERRWPGAFLEGKPKHSHPSLPLTLNLWQKSRKQGARESHVASPGDTCQHEGAQAPLPQCPVLQESWGSRARCGGPGTHFLAGSPCSRPGSQ